MYCFDVRCNIVYAAGVILFNSLSTWNGHCAKLPKIPVSPAELQALRAVGCVEPASKKANLISAEDLVGMLQGIKRSDLVSLVQQLLSAAGTPLSQTLAIVPAPTHTHGNNNNNNTTTTTNNTTKVSQNQNTGFAAALAAISHLSMPDAVNDEPQLSQPVYQTTSEQNQHTGMFLLPHQMPPAATPITAPDLTPTPATISLGDKPKTAFKKYSLDERHFSPIFELQLAQLQSFWMSPSSLKRQQNPVNIVTYNKCR
jgi:hypothetical protein